MKVGFIIKLLAGVLLIVLVAFGGYKLVTIITGTVSDMLTGSLIGEDSTDYQLYTPEPMPTMPDYMGDDSFYDNAGSVDFGDE